MSSGSRSRYRNDGGLIITEIITTSIKTGWPRLLLEVLKNGKEVDVVADGVPRKTLELPYPVMVRVERPLKDMEAVGSRWTGAKLRAYADQLVYGENTEGFVYNYHDRLFSYPAKYSAMDTEQIDKIIRDLKDNGSSRGEIAVTWQPEVDLGSNQAVPCLIICDFVLRDNYLNLVVYFRSHDLFAAWPTNSYGLAKLLEYVTKQLHNVNTGSLTVISNKGHLYAEDWTDSRRIAGLVA